jgi:hypothetical protein
MKKALLLILAVGIANAAVLSAANTTENHRTTASDNAGQYYAADYRLERGAYRYTHRLSDYPYYRGYTSMAAGSGGHCSYGSYVACVYSNTFCWQRCY